MPEEILFAFMHSVMKKMRKMADGELYPLVVSHAEMRILMLIYYYGDSSQEEMVARLGVDRSNVGRSLKKLEKTGYIVRKKDDQDGRAFRILLTEKGRSVRDRLLEIRRKIQKTFSMGMTRHDLSHLVKILEKADRNLNGADYLHVKDSENKASWPDDDRVREVKEPTGF